MVIDPQRWAMAFAMLAAYALMCILLARARWRAGIIDAPCDPAAWVVAYASQTGTGEYLARQTLATLLTSGVEARSLSLEQLDEASLLGARRVLFIVSTYGEGDAPDGAERFARILAGIGSPLAQLHYGLLALGDSSYAHFCGFGRRLDTDLRAHGAQPLFARVDVDRGAAAAFATWQHHLSHLAGTSDAPDWGAPAYGNWRLASRRLLNPGSAGAPVYRIGLQPEEGPLPPWQAGDLVQVGAPGDPDYPRDYSIASIAGEGQVELLVRLRLRDDGSSGLASGWLCRDAAIGARVALRVREHSRFRIGENGTRPLILIGNGTGMAGLRAHLKQRVDTGEGRNWLLFGERNAAHDAFCGEEILAWQEAKMLEAVSLAYSRDGGAVRYVQHALAQQASRLQAWVDRGAAIYVCGSLHGMASSVHEVLVEALGQERVDKLTDSGCYRRDVY